MYEIKYIKHYWEDIQNLEARSGVSIVSLDTYLRACTELLYLANNKNVIALKIALAYERSLKFDRPDRTDSEKGFRDLVAQKHIPTWEIPSVVPSSAFQDCVLHHILE